MIRWPLSGLLATSPVGDGVMAIRDGIVNLYVVQGPAGLICIDAGWRPTAVEAGFAALGLDPMNVAAVFLTHRHWDHARAASLFVKAVVSTRTSDVCAGLAVRAIATPGHTADSMSYLVDGRLLFTGDLLRLRAGKAVPNHWWLGGNQKLMRQSIRKLSAITDVECLLTAHTGLTRNFAEALADYRSPVPCKSF